MTNLLVVRHHCELGSVQGVFGKKEKPFDYSWGSHNWYWKDEHMGDEGKLEERIQEIVETVFDLCAKKMKEQGVEDDGEIAFVARVKGKKVTKLVVLGEDFTEEEFQSVLDQV